MPSTHARFPPSAANRRLHCPPSLMLEEQFRQGCRSPVLYIEAWNLIAANPALLMRLGGFELQVLYYAAKKEILSSDVIIQIVYLAQKTKIYSARLFEILKVCYRSHRPETKCCRQSVPC